MIFMLFKLCSDSLRRSLVTGVYANVVLIVLVLSYQDYILNYDCETECA